MSTRTRLSENQKAAANFIKFFVVLVILGVVVYSEIMFIGIVGVLFPTGVLRIAAIIGAVATGASIMLLYAGKSHWFTPGSQLIAAWIFTGMEVTVMVLNDILAYSMHGGTVDSYLQIWQEFTPASPVIALVGWVIITYLDVSERERHKDMEMEAQRNQAEREYTIAAHEATITLKEQHLKQVTARLQDVLSSDAVQAQIAQHAQRMVAQVLTDVSGINAPIELGPLPPPRVVESNPLAQATSKAPDDKGFLAQAADMAKNLFGSTPAPAQPVSLAQTAVIPPSPGPTPDPQTAPLQTPGK